MVSDNKNLLLDDGSHLRWLEKDCELYLNKTTLLFGRTQSGKSTIIFEIMKLCEKKITGAFVICQSSITTESSDFYKYVPNNCIKSNVSKEWLEMFTTIQKGRASIYKTANNIENLRSLFNKTKSQNDITIEYNINKKAKECTDLINNNQLLDYAQKREQTMVIEKTKHNYLMNLYRSTIRRYKINLEIDIKTLTSKEICCLQYLDFNPNVLIVWDDCASIFKKIAKETPEIQEIFYNGRHYYITQIMSFQDDKSIDSELRKNALVNIFTTSEAATANFDRKSNSYSKDQKKRSELCCKKVFSNTPGITNFKKLVYLQNNTTDPFAYIIADTYKEFQVGCPAIWEVDEKISKKSDDVVDNQFVKKYTSL